MMAAVADQDCFPSPLKPPSNHLVGINRVHRPKPTVARNVPSTSPSQRNGVLSPPTTSPPSSSPNKRIARLCNTPDNKEPDIAARFDEERRQWIDEKAHLEEQNNAFASKLDQCEATAHKRKLEFEKLQGEFADQHQTCAQAMSENEELRMSNSDLLERNSRLEVEADRCSEKCRRIEGELEETNASSHQEIQRLHALIKTSEEKQQTELKACRSAFEQNCADMSERIGELETDLSVALKERDIAMANGAKARRVNDDLQQTIAELEQELSAAPTREHCEALERDLVDERSARQNIDDECRLLKEQRDAALNASLHEPISQHLESSDTTNALKSVVDNSPIAMVSVLPKSSVFVNDKVDAAYQAYLDSEGTSSESETSDDNLVEPPVTTPMVHSTTGASSHRSFLCNRSIHLILLLTLAVPFLGPTLAQFLIALHTESWSGQPPPI